MRFTDNEVAVLVVMIGSLAPTLAAVAAWASAHNNATQESVDTLHDCLNKHTEQDEANFGELLSNQEHMKKSIVALKKQVDRRATEIKGAVPE